MKWPKQQWRGRGKCFALFEQALRPSGISPRMSGRVKRRSLYKYFEEYKLLKAKRIVDLAIAAERARQEIEARGMGRHPTVSVRRIQRGPRGL